MKDISVKDLHTGMVIAEDVCFEGKVLVSGRTVLGSDDIRGIQGILEDGRVKVYDLTELKPLLLKSSQTTLAYINFILKPFSMRLMDATLEGWHSKLLKGMEGYLYTNRSLLYEAILLYFNHDYTYEHSLNTALYSFIIGLNEELTSEELENLVIGCVFHDIGKKSISNEILDSPRKLTDDEFTIIKKHPVYGVEYVNEIEYLNGRVRNIILQHHEKLNGSGYPLGLGYSEIDHLAKIAAVADIFDAVTSKRSYHDERPVNEGIRILREEVKKGALAVDEVNMLVRGLTSYPINTLVLLNDERVGYVLENKPNLIVMLLDGVVVDVSATRDLRVMRVL